MALDPITAVSDLATTVVNKLWPDKSAQEAAQLAAAVAMVQGQLNIDQAEAASPSMFTSGWRPFVGWVCGTACAWNWIGLPIAKFAGAYLGHPIALSAADTAEMMPLLMAMLGMGGLRSFDKLKGTAS